MVRQLRQVQVTIRGILGVAAVTAVLGLAACGSVKAATGSQPRAGASAAAATPPVSHAAAGAPLCAGLAHVSTVAITPIAGLPHSRGPVPMVRGLVIRDPARARELAAAMCALPAMGGGPVNCPLDSGGGYRMVFSAGGRDFPGVTVKSSGCRTVTGLGPVLRTGATFWKVFSQVLRHGG